MSLVNVTSRDVNDGQNYENKTKNVTNCNLPLSLMDENYKRWSIWHLPRQKDNTIWGMLESAKQIFQKIICTSNHEVKVEVSF